MKFFEYLSFFGNVEMEIELKNALGVKIPHPLRNSIDLYEDDKVLKILHNDIIWRRKVNIRQLDEGLSDFLIDLLLEIAWSLNIKYLDRERIIKQLNL